MESIARGCLFQNITPENHFPRLHNKWQLGGSVFLHMMDAHHFAFSLSLTHTHTYNYRNWELVDNDHCCETSQRKTKIQKKMMLHFMHLARQCCLHLLPVCCSFCSTPLPSHLRSAEGPCKKRLLRDAASGSSSLGKCPEPVACVFKPPIYWGCCYLKIELKSGQKSPFPLSQKASIPVM